MTSWDDIIRFNDRHFPGWRNSHLVFLSNAMAGEAGEAADDLSTALLAILALNGKVGAFANDTKHLVGGGTNKRIPSKATLLSELVDVYFYLTLGVECLGFDEQAFNDAVQSKLFENYERMEKLKGST